MKDGKKHCATIPLLYYIDGREVAREEFERSRWQASLNIAQGRLDGESFVPRVIELDLDTLSKGEESFVPPSWVMR